MGMHDGHRERVRQEFLSAGLDSFPDHKVLELLLYPVLPRMDTNPIAHRLIETFGSFSAVFDAPYEELVKVPGVGRQTAVLIKLIPGLHKRYLLDKEARGVVLDSPEAAGNYIRTRFVGATQEMVYVVCLDSKCKVLLTKRVSEGSVHATEINIRRIAEIVLRSGAAFVVMAHNHPGGLALPSPDDVASTRKMVEALRLIGIQLIDHIVVADGDFISMAQSGSLSQIFCD